MTHLLRALCIALLLTAAAPGSAAVDPAADAAAPGPIHQLRVYQIFERNREAFHERFRDHAVRIMARHGFRIVAMWETRHDGRLEFVYLLQWPDEATMRASWTSFMADAEWAEIKRRTGAANGALVGEIQERVLRPTDYTPDTDLLRSPASPRSTP